MINIPGKKVIIDADALIGIINKEDLLHKQSIIILDYIENNNITLVVPYPIVLEAATTLSRGRPVSRPDLSAQLLRYYLEVDRDFAYDNKVADLVADLYDPKTSKKNTPFDHYVLALAKKNNIQHVFSFDSFYKKNGLTLMEDVI